jgi:hypothetical protein
LCGSAAIAATERALAADLGARVLLDDVRGDPEQPAARRRAAKSRRRAKCAQEAGLHQIVDGGRVRTAHPRDEAMHDVDVPLEQHRARRAIAGGARRDEPGIGDSLLARLGSQLDELAALHSRCARPPKNCTPSAGSSSST